MTSEAENYTRGTEIAQAYFSQLSSTLKEINIWQICKAAKYIRNTHTRGGTVWCAGNGGSQANSAHLSLHLQEHGIRAIDMMGESAISSALGNDITFEGALAKRMRLLSKPEDLLIILSGSGNSINLITAIAEARKKAIQSIGLLGFGGGLCAGLVRVPIILRTAVYGPVEDAHSVIIHILAEQLGKIGAGPPLTRS